MSARPMGSRKVPALADFIVMLSDLFIFILLLIFDLLKQWEVAPVSPAAGRFFCPFVQLQGAVGCQVAYVFLVSSNIPLNSVSQFPLFDGLEGVSSPLP